MILVDTWLIQRTRSSLNRLKAQHTLFDMIHKKVAETSSFLKSTCEVKALMGVNLFLVFGSFRLHKRGEPRFIGDNSLSSKKVNNFNRCPILHESVRRKSF